VITTVTETRAIKVNHNGHPVQGATKAKIAITVTEIRAPTPRPIATVTETQATYANMKTTVTETRAPKENHSGHLEQGHQG